MKTQVILTAALALQATFGYCAYAAEPQAPAHIDGIHDLERRLFFGPDSGNSAGQAGGASFIARKGAAKVALRVPKSMAAKFSCSSTYRITDLGTLGGSESFGDAINDLGTIVGGSRIAGDSESHSFVYRNGRLTDIQPLDSGAIRTGNYGINRHNQIASGVMAGGVYQAAVYDWQTRRITELGTLGGIDASGFSSAATAINDDGEVAGYAYIDGSQRHAFIYSEGVMTDIGSFGGWSVAFGINNKGVVVGGAAKDPYGSAHAFVYADGTMTDINPFDDPGFAGSESYAHAVNGRGQVAGVYRLEDGSDFRGFIYHKGRFTDIASPGNRNVDPLAINDRGTVVGVMQTPYEATCFDPFTGYYACTQYKMHAFTHTDGRVFDLNGLIANGDGWELSWAADVNNRGRIVGYGLKGDQFHAFLLTPTLKSRCAP